MGDVPNPRLFHQRPQKPAAALIIIDDQDARSGQG